MIKLWDRIGDWVILFLLIVLAGMFLLWRNEPAVRGLRARSLEAAATIENQLAWIGDYLTALEENNRLRADNIRLSSQLARSREAAIENDRLRRLLGLRDTVETAALAAEIVSKNLTLQRNLLTINVGRRDGVEPGMPVVDERGVIGKVVLVSNRFSRVMPYLNTEMRIPAKIQPSETPGIIRWDGDLRSRLLMEHVVKTEPVQKGQMVVASGFSQVFPEGYPIGVIDSVVVRPGRIELILFVSPLADVGRSEHVFVLLNRPDQERVQIEAQTVN